MNDDTSDGAHDQHAAPWPAQQVYFVTVTWQDEPHAPESPERLAQVLRHALEHAHRAGPDAAPARFVVRVKAGDVAAEAAGTVAPHHHHHHDPQP